MCVMPDSNRMPTPTESRQKKFSHGLPGFCTAAEMPFVPELRCATADLVGKVPPDFLRPAPDSFMADHNSTPSQQVFDHPQAEWKPKIEPDGVSDDLSREAMTAVKGVANLAHTRKIIQTSGTAISVTVPAHHRARRFAAAAWAAPVGRSWPPTVDFAGFCWQWLRIASCHRSERRWRDNLIFSIPAADVLLSSLAAAPAQFQRRYFA